MAVPLKKLTFVKTFSSPRQRAIQTSTLAGFQSEIDSDLVEWNYGDFEGLTSAEIQQITPNWNLFTDGAPNGESLQQVSDRADRFLKKIRDIEGTIAIFSHGHFSRVLAARFLGLTIPQASILYLVPASISKLGHEHKKPVIKLWNSTSHFN